jgi:hypothetical protein
LSRKCDLILIGIIEEAHRIASPDLPWHVLDHRVAAARDGFNKARILGRISKRVSNFADGLVETMVEVHDRLRPDPCAQFLPADQFSWPLQQHRQQLEGLLLQGEAFAVFRELPKSSIGFKNSEAQTSRWVVGIRHGKQIRTSLFSDSL